MIFYTYYLILNQKHIHHFQSCQINKLFRKYLHPVLSKSIPQKNIQYLNINEVNRLQPTEKDIPEPCVDGLQLEAPCGPAKVIFMGGGGVGVQGNPIIGKDGGLLGIDLVSGGFGYQYPPKV